VQRSLLTLGDTCPELPGIPHPLEVLLDAFRAHAEAVIADGDADNAVRDVAVESD
jgi:hypothetical protein